VNAAPKDHEEFYRRYRAYVRRLLLLHGIPLGEVDEQVNDLFARWMTTGMLGRFDWNYESERNPGEKARFEPYLSQHVKLAARGRREQIQKRTSREPVILNSPAGSHEKTTWADLLDTGTHDPRYFDVEYQQFVTTVRSYLETIPRRSPMDVRDLPLLFMRVVAQVETLGRIDKHLLMEGPWEPHKERGEWKTTISSSVIRNWLVALREYVKEAIELFDLTKKGAW
jgi:hypothetical protein